MSVFVDTNVLVYRFDESDPAKSARSEAWLRELWGRGEGRVSVQVLQELFVTLTRKVSRPMPSAEARLVVKALFSWDPVVPDRAVLEAA